MAIFPAIPEVQLNYSIKKALQIMEKKITIAGKLLLLLIFIFGVFSGSSLAAKADISYADEKQQEIEVSGTVTDVQTGDPLPGVNIVVQGTTTGTTTDMDGEYSIEAPADATLVFSFVGYQEQTLEINGREEINVAMEQAVTQLEEVVAVGYGSLQRNKVSTSISSVKPERLEAQVTTSLDGALEGQIAGVEVKQNTGAPGGGSIMRIRGAGSIGASSEPLVVVDGIPIQNSYDKRTSPLSTISQSNIESIDILKGVSATAIYGSRGDNGVIIISTNSAETEETQVSFTAKSGVSHMLASEKLDLMNAEEFARWRKQNRFEEAEFYGYEISLEDIPEEYRHPEEWRGKGTDWQDVITRIAPQSSFNLNVSHGTEDFKSYSSIDYLDQKGIIKETGFQRLNLRSNLDYELNDMITAGIKIHPTLRWWNNQAAGGTSTTGSRGLPLGTAILNSPLDGPYKDDGVFEEEEYFDGKWDTAIHSADMFHGSNPLHRLDVTVDETQYFNMDIQPNLQINPLQGLTFRSQLNLQLSHESYEYFKPSTVTNIKSPPPTTIEGDHNTTRRYYWQFENTLNYERTFGGHTVSGLAGYTMERYNSYSSSIHGYNYPDDAVKTLNAASETVGSTGESNWSLISYLFRVSYDYNAKYLFTGTMRRDGSSRFGSENKWGYFPSASIGWNLSKESFFPDPQWLTNLKLRTSYGFSGNNSIGNYTWISDMTIDNYTFGGEVIDGKSIAAMENIHLSWQRSREFDVGMDLTLFDGRLNFIFDYYSKITENMLWGVDIPGSSGYTSMMKNLGEIRNRGMEFTVNSVNVSNSDLTWETDFNISINRNKVLDLGPVERILYGHRNAWLTTVGKPMAMFRGYKSLGVIKDWEEFEEVATFASQTKPGTPHYADTDGNGIIDDRDKTIVGNPHPDFRGGISNTLNYKNWDFSINMSFAHNFDVWAELEEEPFNYDGVFNVHKEVEQRWKSPEEPGNGRIPATFHEQHFDRWANSDWSYNVSFLKIQNLNVGYTFDNPNFANISNLRINLSVQNLYTFTNYRYGNPDVNLAGSSALRRNNDKYDYPLSRTIVLGLNINF
mgnify:CR=1 FL=1